LNDLKDLSEVKNAKSVDKIVRKQTLVSLDLLLQLNWRKT